MDMTRRLTMAQATIQFLKAQFVRRDGKEQAFFGGCVGIFDTATSPASAKHSNKISIFPTTCFATSRAWCMQQLVSRK
jgi:TPP-dependent trihydroxycyclohexane-1,2-dione (THcHDO) dehydratase